MKHRGKRGVSRRLDDLNYSLCIICQRKGAKNMFNVTAGSLPVLHKAIEERHDDTAKRLQPLIKDDEWLQTMNPKWHKSCRSAYLLTKNVHRAKKKRMINMPTCTSQNVADDEQADTSPTTSPVKTRSKVPSYKARTMCLICNKVWCKGKRPISKVSTDDRDETLKAKAKQLNRQDIRRRIRGKGHDMVSNDICYHKQCMDVFMNTRVPRGKEDTHKLHDEAFSELVKQVDAQLFDDANGIMLSSLRGIYQRELTKLGLGNRDPYKITRLKEKLIKHYGSRLTILEQSHGSAFVCSSSVPVGDCIAQMKALQNAEDDSLKAGNRRVLKKAAKILRNDAKACKREASQKDSIEITRDSASGIVPDSFYNFTSYLLTDKVKEVDNNDRVVVDKNKEDNALMLSQQMLHHTSGVMTPLGIGTTYSLYNETRSKSLVTLNNKLKQGISYDTLQRQLTAKSTEIQQAVEQTGIYIPENMTACHDHVFAMDNLDWKNQTLSGGSFNATSAIIVETPIASTDETISER
ncbi:MAG: hypothetical protein ABW185_06285, partial [Sedimenticola sp.]